ncbi:MAG: glycerophosphodiester phosphodiesterase [Deltaproteobacteria bacterium]|nr:glycerophosphodiester phosphodiesterase [Deltaproteobacteria bacterium]
MVHIMGHRGAPAYEPENTLRSVARALDMGVAAVEVDVQLTRDGRLVVIHDETVDRTTNGAGWVRDLTFAQVRELDAGQGERIPALEEVVDLVRSRGAHLVVEVKQPEAAPACLEFFRGHPNVENMHLISFWHPLVRWLKEQEPRLRTGVLMVGCPADPVGLARAALAEALVLHFAYVTPELVAAAHAQGLLVYIWNIDAPAWLPPYLEMKVDGIGSNRPDVLIEYLRKR